MRITTIIGSGKFREARLDDGRSFKILFELLLAQGLGEGSELTDERLQALLSENSRRSCMLAAIAAVSRHAMSQSELRRALISRRHTPESISNAISECVRLKLLDDVEYAKAYAAELAGKGMGKRRILMSLAQRGIAKELAEDACEGLDANAETVDGGEERRARELLARKLKSMGRAVVEPRKLRARLIRFLYSRGFQGDLAVRVVDDSLKSE